VWNIFLGVETVEKWKTALQSVEKPVEWKRAFKVWKKLKS
jgi:hypothetical protein